jgi:acetyl-CoA/propionyl-CoA carboxylase biotin carboxyl carrier protein
MFSKVLIANRGEIAVRVAKTLRRLGIRSVAVYSEPDADARHVREADDAVLLGPAAARESYLSIPKIIAAARETGAEAIHPGYGFLSENTEFAAACEEAGIAFIGPPSSAIDAMGDKIRAKLTVSAAGVPVVPGRTAAGMSDADLADAATEIGYPVLLKPSAGGGGKGMRLVSSGDEIAEAIASARREAASSFGDDTLLIERFVRNPRHIEIQVLADTHGTTIHLGERECSLQRRHQKIVEEAPSTLLDSVTRQRMGDAAVNAAAAVGYVGAGTVEFIVSADRPDEFFFMEMNTRLQVEHPVTEMITGVDLVEQQLLAASGERITVSGFEPDGHAVEVRVYAETLTDNGFLPSGGTVLALREPADSVRVDSGISLGDQVSSFYDPMLAKFIAHAPTREQALGRLRSALADTVLLGVGNNIGFLAKLLADSDVLQGNIDTALVERKQAELVDGAVPAHVLTAAAMERVLALEAQADTSPWSKSTGWRVGANAWASWQVKAAGEEPVTIKVRGTSELAEIVVGQGDPVRASAQREGELVVTADGRRRGYSCAIADGVLWLGHAGRTWSLTETERLAAARTDAAAASGGPVTSPMPGTVLLVKAAVGDEVVAGQAIAVVEAMKMEHTITAPIDGVVSEVRVQVAQSVALDEILAVIEVAE